MPKIFDIVKGGVIIIFEQFGAFVAGPDNRYEDHGDVFLTWKISEYEKHNRSMFWYVIMLLIAAGLIIYSVTSDNFLFAILIMLAIFIVFLRNYYAPRELDIKLTEDGILIGPQYFSYKSLSNFYLIYDPPLFKKLFISFKGMAPDLGVELGNINPLVVREILMEYLEEDVEKEDEDLGETIGSILQL